MVNERTVQGIHTEVVNNTSDNFKHFQNFFNHCFTNMRSVQDIC